MELRAFAEQVLRSTHLEDKLFSPSSFTDHHAGAAWTGPAQPGRPTFLPLAPTRPIPPTPSPHQLEEDTVRGQALHTFAHHELQALELMALALLRFPAAPTGFRLGLARIICDEQRHFELYRDRAEHWGVGLGDVGASHFFWDTVADIDSPQAFLAALSLTYEQANLDFAVYWRSAFAAVGDTPTADAIQTVYEDEIRHVRHGVEWYRRMTGTCDFEHYQSALVFPLSPGRGKGPVFDRAGRVAAGLSDAFIDEMELSNVSRGRPPRVFSFDPLVEAQVAGRPIKKAMRTLADDLTSVMMFLAHREDVVVGARPSLPVLQRLHTAGFEIPQFVPSIDALGERSIDSHQPWGWSAEVADRLDQSWDEALGVLYDKTWAFHQRQRFWEAHPSPLLVPIQGSICHCMEEAEALVKAGGEWIAKAPLSTSGQHRIRMRGEIHEAARAWLTRHLTTGPVLIEPWYTRLADLSIQVQITADRTVIEGITRFWTAGSGVYRGAVIGRWTHGLSSEVVRALHGGRANDVLEASARTVAASARALGYTGPLGIDAMVVQTPDGIRLLPILEVNPRYTMGRVALALQRRCTGHGGWFFLDHRQIEAAGFADPDALKTAVLAQPIEANSRGLQAGIVWTTEPSTSQRVVTVLCIGPTARQAAAQWTQLGFDWPD